MEELTSFSVLMSVYYKEKAEYFQKSIQSIYNQTVKTDDFVLVCDGPLTRELDFIVDWAKEKFGNSLQVIRLNDNCGLGNALNIGLQYCRYELVARMDSDDVCFPNRFEKQINFFRQHPEVHIISGAVLEFTERVDVINGKRTLPEKKEMLYTFSKKRNPFNHPAVMFKKTEVKKAGGYLETFPLFEDYFLWIRMFQNGSVGYNLQEPILYMRVPKALYVRRGGWKYAINMLRYRNWMRKSGWCSTKEYLLTAIPHAVVCVMPVFCRKIVYRKLHN